MTGNNQNVMLKFCSRVQGPASVRVLPREKDRDFRFERKEKEIMDF